MIRMIKRGVVQRNRYWSVQYSGVRWGERPEEESEVYPQDGGTDNREKTTQVPYVTCACMCVCVFI